MGLRMHPGNTRCEQSTSARAAKMFMSQCRQGFLASRVPVHVVFVFFYPPFSVSSKVPILAKTRSRVRAGSAQRQAARPVWVGEVEDFIQGRRIGMCWSRHGPGTS